MGQDAHMIDDMTPREMYKMLKRRARHHAVGWAIPVYRLKAKMPGRHQPASVINAYAGMKA